VLLYVTGDDGSPSVGTLWARFGQQTPIKVGERGHLGLTRLTTEGEIRAVLDWGDVGGTLLKGEVDQDLDTLARDVVYYTSFGVIGDWDGQNGTLYQFEGDELVRVQRNVTTRGFRYDSLTKRGLVLVGFDGDRGELTLIQDGDATPLSKNVRENAYQFTVQLPTVTILSDLDDETGTATLKLRQTQSAIETVVSDGVSEVLEVSWPKAGFLYSVPKGDRAGIWFTDAQ
jgi:hypothetical protein